MTYEYQQYLAHYGVKGQKWGRRNYQNEDGSYTTEGAERYWGGGHGRQPGAGPSAPAAPKSGMRRSTLNGATRFFSRITPSSKFRKRAYQRAYGVDANDKSEEAVAEKQRRKKKAIAIAATAAAVSVAALYGYSTLKRNAIRRNYTWASEIQRAGGNYASAAASKRVADTVNRRKALKIAGRQAAEAAGAKVERAKNWLKNAGIKAASSVKKRKWR